MTTTAQLILRWTVIWTISLALVLLLFSSLWRPMILLSMERTETTGIVVQTWSKESRVVAYSYQALGKTYLLKYLAKNSGPALGESVRVWYSPRDPSIAVYGTAPEKDLQTFGPLLLLYMISIASIFARVIGRLDIGRVGPATDE